MSRYNLKGVLNPDIRSAIMRQCALAPLERRKLSVSSRKSIYSGGKRSGQSFRGFQGSRTRSSLVARTRVSLSPIFRSLVRDQRTRVTATETSWSTKPVTLVTQFTRGTRHMIHRTSPRSLRAVRSGLSLTNPRTWTRAWWMSRSRWARRRTGSWMSRV